MTRFTTILILLIATVLILIGAWWYFFFEKGTVPTPQTTASSTSRAFTPLNNSVPPEQTPEKPTVSSTTEPLVEATPDTKKRVKKLYTTPVAFGILASSTASSTSVYFIDRGTGHIYNAKVDADVPEKVSNTTILRVYESYFDTQAKNVLMRYIKEGTDVVTSVVAPITDEIKAKFLSTTIDTLATSPKGDKIFFIEKTATGVIGYVSKLDGTVKKAVFESPLKEWVVTWPEENIVTLTTKASRFNPGYLYFLNLKTGKLAKVLGPIYGLTTSTSRDAKKVIYSKSVSGKTETRVLTVAENSNQETLFLTLPEKCVWSTVQKSSVYCAVPSEPQKNLPDDWYKGLLKPVDQIWHLDTVTNSINKVSNLFEDAGTDIDAVNLTLPPNEQALFFINNSDLSLWSVDLAD